MVELFRNAFNYLTSSNEKQDNEFVGRVIVLGSKRLLVRRLLAEGGFGYVFVVTDSDGNSYALKRLIAGDKDSADAIRREIFILKEASGHPNILHFCQAACEQQPNGRTEFLILTELCSGGPLLDRLRARRTPLEFCEVLPLFYQICCAVDHLHGHKPPIIHRDLKMENLLLDSMERVKLCDFGSATEKSYKPDDTWTAQRRSMLEEELNKCTTPMYRAPEMLDSYQNLPIDQRIDVWALGCILYYLCYMVHPFEDSAKLRILNANYTLPEKDDRCGVLHSLIGKILQVTPDDRPSVKEILRLLEDLAACYGADLKAKVRLGPADETHVGNAQAEMEASSGGMGVFLESLKGQAGSIFKSLIETSSKIVQPTSAMPSRNSLTYLTSRLVLLSSPVDVGCLEDSVKQLTARHGKRFFVYDLCCWYNGDLPLGERVMRCRFPAGSAPTLKSMFSLCKNVYLWLRQDVANVAVFFSDNEGNSACVACSFLVFSKNLSHSAHCRQLLTDRGCTAPLTPSQARYVDYVASVLRHPTFYPQASKVVASKLSVSPVPIFNRMRNGCRPFVEVFSGDNKLLSTCQEYEKIPFIDVSEAGFTIPLNMKFDGDATFVVSHARSTLGTKMQRKLNIVKMFQFQVHAGFLDPSRSALTLELNDLCCIGEEWKYPRPFVVRLAYVATEDERCNDSLGQFLPNFNPDAIVTHLPFSSPEESANFQKRYGDALQDHTELRETSKVELPKQPAERLTASDLLSSLDWQSPLAEQCVSSIPCKGAEVPVILQPMDCEQIEHLKITEDEIEEPKQSSHVGAESYELVNLDADDQPTGNVSCTNVGLLLNSYSGNPTCFGDSDVDLTSKPPAAECASANVDSHRENLLFGLSTGATPTHHVLSEMNLSTPVHMHRNLSTPLLLDDQEPFSTLGETRNVAAKSSTAFTVFETLQPSPTINKTEVGGSSAAERPLRPPSAFSRPGECKARADMWSSATSARAKLDSTAFEDLLSSHGFSGSASSKQSLASMKQEAECQGLTEEEAKVRKWTNGKRRNIRGLLGSLHTVIWPENDRWQEVSMSQLLSAKEVKKHYRKACLAVHPDKFVGTPHETLAKLIFTELNDAWNEFEADTTVTPF
uniref:Protein kinase domain-containing protein n=1 Tax=Trichuris muris TaxID=70415 RepID=A0A5S6Q6U7_TRIMR